MSQPENWMTPKEVAQRLGRKDPRPIRAMALAGAFGPDVTDVNGRYLIAETAVTAYLRRNRLPELSR